MRSCNIKNSSFSPTAAKTQPPLFGAYRLNHNVKLVLNLSFQQKRHHSSSPLSAGVSETGRSTVATVGSPGVLARER